MLREYNNIYESEYLTTVKPILFLVFESLAWGATVYSRYSKFTNVCNSVFNPVK